VLAGIHQLHYVPWLRYFEKIESCDSFIVLDDIQYSKNGWQNRNRIKSKSGPLLLTVPVHAPLGKTLDRIEICNDTPWQRKHWNAIEQSYTRAPYFAEYAAFLEDVYQRDWRMLNDLNGYLFEFFINALSIDTEIHFSSQLGVPGTATERLANLIEAVGGDAYYSGAYALDAYLDADVLRERGIRLELQRWSPPVYPQMHGEFVPDLSILDLLFNCGADSLSVLAGKPA